MRRAIWLTAGAALGVVGYRRLDRAAKSLTGRLRTARPAAPPVRQSAGDRAAASPGRRSEAAVALSTAIWTARQVRAVLQASRTASVQAGTFMTEVRAGMAEYLQAHERKLNRQHTGSGSTLVGQSPQARRDRQPRAGERLVMPARPAGALGAGHDETPEIKDGR
jgi:hypothetical protein